MTIGRAARDAIVGAVSQFEIMADGGTVLAVIPYPGSRGEAIASGTAGRWRMTNKFGGLLAEGQIGDGVTLDRTDIQRGGIVTFESIEIEVKG